MSLREVSSGIDIRVVANCGQGRLMTLLCRVVCKPFCVGILTLARKKSSRHDRRVSLGPL